MFKITVLPRWKEHRWSLGSMVFFSCSPNLNFSIIPKDNARQQHTTKIVQVTKMSNQPKLIVAHLPGIVHVNRYNWNDDKLS